MEKINTFTDLSVLIQKKCKSDFANQTISKWTVKISELANLYDLPHQTIEKRIRLLLPSLSRRTILESKKNIPQQLLSPLHIIFKDYKNNFTEFIHKSGSQQFLEKSGESFIVNNLIKFTNGKSIDIYFSKVANDIGQFIESKLHYLMSPRMDTLFRFGIFVKGYSYPFCYMSFSTTDRIYKVSCIENIIGKELPPNKILNLARVYGCGNLPKNSISSLIAYCERHFREFKFDYLTTAVNPFMGFSGKSIFASNFSPIALCYVSYYYDSKGLYVSRRQRTSSKYAYSKQKTPPNIIFIKGLNKISKRIIRKHIKLLSITKKMYLEDEKTKQHIAKMKQKVNLLPLRHDMEKVWNSLTKYHGTEKSPNDPISKGQCGVTSAYLATEFEQQGFETLFCRGDVIFPGGVPPIKNHCWLKIPKYHNEGMSIENLIIDLTADQSGYSESVICDTDESLRDKGIYYENSYEVVPKEVKFGSLNDRLNMLDKRLKRLNKP